MIRELMCSNNGFGVFYFGISLFVMIIDTIIIVYLMRLLEKVKEMK
jgi:hypothetical protein